MKPLTLVPILAVALLVTVLLKKTNEPTDRTVATPTAPVKVVELVEREEANTYTLVSDQGKPVVVAEDMPEGLTGPSLHFVHGLETKVRVPELSRVPDRANRGYHFVVARMN